MDLQFETCKETRNLVIWNVGVPRVHREIKSNAFQVFDCYWYLVLTVSSGIFSEFWEISLISTDYNKKTPCFPLIVYIRHRGKDLYLCQTEINGRLNRIRCCDSFIFRGKYSSIDVVGKRVHFVFDFHLRKLDLGISIAEEKSVKTPKYPENHSCLENLSLDLSKLIEGGTDTDVLMKCGDVSMGAHKMILGARSEVFRTMMQTDMVEGREGIVEISDMEPEILKIFIKYIYTGILPELTMDTALPIYEAADKYQVEALKKRSGHLLVKNLSPENALAILVAADAHSDTDLKDQVVSYISEEKIPSRKEEWLNFCNEYPKLATQVLNFMFLE